MPMARVTSKGQVTVPKAIRRALGIEQGDLLVFDPHPEGHVELRRLPGRSLAELHGMLAVAKGVPHLMERRAYRGRLARRLGRTVK
ncbi:MAG: AbrB/MazE/SpoVT family DNA-binding domain-containing protein [Armatimonadota bacterium]